MRNSLIHARCKTPRAYWDNDGSAANAICMSETIDDDTLSGDLFVCSEIFRILSKSLSRQDRQTYKFNKDLLKCSLLLE